MIPKIIHYCWFGGNPLPQSAIKCINSWKRFFPDYEIKQWDETNFDVNIIPYTRDAYSIRKYAFVSDYARMWVLYNFGGIYFDTDVEVVRSFDDILSKGGFMGFETSEYVAPGLGMALQKKSRIASDVMKRFEQTEFFLNNGTFNSKGIVPITTWVLKKYGLKSGGEMQKIGEDLWIYPIEFFNPLDAPTGRIRKTLNTHSIHWYTKSWMDNQNWVRTLFSHWFHRVFGTSLPIKIKRLIGKKNV